MILTPPQVIPSPVAAAHAGVESWSRGGSRRWFGVACVFVATLIPYGLFSVSQWMRFESPSWDLGIFTQLAKQYAALHPPIVDIKGSGFNLLGDHFSPLLALLVPVYAAFPSGLTLMLVQDVLFALSAAAITYVASQLIGNWTGAAVGIAFGVSFGLQGAVESQFHEIAFAVPLLTFSLSAFMRRNWLWSAVWAAPLVFVKEDLGLTVFAIGLLLAWRSKKPLGMWLAVWGLAWFGITTLVLIPMTNSRHQWDYGGTIPVLSLLRQPWMLAVSLVDDPQKVTTLLFLVGVTALLGLRSPVFLLVIPTILWRFWSTNSGYYGHTWQYSADLMPVVFVALIDAIRSTSSSRHRLVRWYGKTAGYLALIVALALIPQLALARLGQPGFYEPSPRGAEAAAVVALVRPGSTVETDVGLMAYLVPGSTVYYTGNRGNPAPDYVVIDDFGGGWPDPPASAAEWAETAHPGTTYALIYDRAGYQVAQRDSDRRAQ